MATREFPRAFLTEMLQAAIAYSESIAFWNDQRGYVCYSVAYKLEARKALEQAAYDYGRSLRTQSALETCDYHP